MYPYSPDTPPLLGIFSEVPRGQGWENAKKPVLVLDGQVTEWQQGKTYSGHAAFIVGANEETFDALCMALSVKIAVFYEMRVSDFSCLQNISGLEHLAIIWNSKAVDLGPLSYLNHLKTLALVDTPKAHDLQPISRLQELRAFEFSGSPTLSSKNTAKSLEPLAALPNLCEMQLTGLKIERDGLRPVARCIALRMLSVSNTFDTEDYAFLAAKMPNTTCSHFSATVRVQGSAIGAGIDTMVVGRRKPFLNSQEDAERIRRYEAAFAKLKEKHDPEKAG